MKKLLSIFTACAVLLAVSSCEAKPADGTDTSAAVSEESVSETAGSDTPVILPEEPHPASLSSITRTLDESGNITVSRYTPEESAPMGAAGTWTVFVYMCGGGLEEEYGMASADIVEMIEASSKCGVKFAVQTGGAETWENGEINTSLTQRFIISGGEMTLDDEQAEVNMGESSSLSAFLTWGVENHPAESMGVVLWGKGNGTASGVCFDERYGGDSLTLREIDAALLTVYEKMTDKFEFIGFDASLMSTIETANILATYAEYMYGSQEIQLGVSWDYTAFGACLAENPAADGFAVGSALAGFYQKSCEGTSAESFVTFSVVKLSEIDALISAYNTYFQMLYAMTEEEVIRADVFRGMEKLERFGGSTALEGYANHVDLMGTVDASPDYFPGKSEVQTALGSAVMCLKNGEAHSGTACGLSVYYPLNINTAAELSAYACVAVSPYQLSFADRYVRSVYDGVFSGEYTNEELLKSWGGFTYSFEDYYSESVYEDYEYTYEEEFYDDYYSYSEDYEITEYWSYADSCTTDGASGLISFTDDPQTDDDSRFYFTLENSSLRLADNVEGYVYKLSEDGCELYDLGVYTGVECNWAENIFSDNYDGKHLTLSDGQELALYLVGKSETAEIYSSPVLVNGEEANLRVAYNREADEAEILSVWSGTDDYGCPKTGTVSLAAGDIIVPIYYTYDVFSDEEYYTEGEECEYDGSGALSVAFLDSGDYCFGFYISDVCGNYYTTDYEYFTVADGEFSFM